ncbi:hypothetical protein [Paracoccus sp. (in: a-proteobacteria)]|uniref:hypothetical protein n=1 Tax=Paracoccus sp. TaxID=267 RepID=UPI00396CF579
MPRVVLTQYKTAEQLEIRFDRRAELHVDEAAGGGTILAVYLEDSQLLFHVRESRRQLQAMVRLASEH